MTEHNGDPETAELVYEIDTDERPSLAVVRAVASLTDTPILDLVPLFDTIDPEYLDYLITNRIDREHERSISFCYHGCRVTVTRKTVRVRTIVD